jgi:AcrR family transcriptional regulator
MLSPGVSRRERKKEETRHRIFHAAIDLFREKGFESTTVDEITERADVARGTFFNYFQRKDQVLAYLSESRILAIEESAAALIAENTPASRKLIEVYLTCAASYEEDRELSRYVLLELMSRTFSQSEDMENRWRDLIVPIIRGGQRRGELRAELDPERLEEFLRGLYYATLYQWACLVRVPVPLREEMRFRFELVMRGLVP